MVSEALQRDVSSPDPELRLFAAFALKRFGVIPLDDESMKEAAADGRGPLPQSLDARDTRYAGRLAWAVSVVDPAQGLIAATELARALNDDRVERRATAEIALRELGERSPEIAEELAVLLASGVDEGRPEAVEAIGRMGVKSQLAIDSLLACLGDPDTAPSGRCALALGRIGASTQEVRDRLAAMMTGTREEVRVPAGRALLMVDPRRFDRELERLGEIDPQRAAVLEDHRRQARPWSPADEPRSDLGHLGTNETDPGLMAGQRQPNRRQAFRGGAPELGSPGWIAAGPERGSP